MQGTISLLPGVHGFAQSAENIGPKPCTSELTMHFGGAEVGLTPVLLQANADTCH